jgi:hypothetical protein
MVSEARTTLRLRKGREVESNHPDDLPLPMPHQGVLPMLPCENALNPDGEKMHSRDPSTCTHSGFAGSSCGAQEDRYSGHQEIVVILKGNK